MSLRRLKPLLAALAIMVLAAGCATSGTDTGKQTAKERAQGILAGHEIADNNNDGTYVSAGPITYQLEISRVLNPYSVEDKQYFLGLPSGQTATGLTPDQLWYGVFLWAKNQHHAAHWTSDRFEIVDTMGNVYHPLTLNSKINQFAWDSEQLQYGDTEPGEDTVASQYYSGGKMVLFKLNSSIYSNRPLTLYILSPENKKIGEISLDL